ncbi:MAG: metallophosphoesterase [Bdellovibrionales bacterium]|nr:metallophosphoesterase [Oligoflexia bacterium]
MAYVLLILCSLLPALAEAKVIQILHTNDLHAALESAGAPHDGEREYGGWAQVKSKMDALTFDATSKGINTIRLDAGDFSEGSAAYFPDQGTHVLRAFQKMGYDAAALGNHDWLMGARSMDDLYGLAPFPFPILAANTKISAKLTHLKKQIIPSTQIIRDGIKFGIFGLSTDEALYSWIPGLKSGKHDFKIKNFRDEIIEDGVYDEPTVVTGVANKMIASLRNDNDVVIALTHIGFANDKRLAAKTRGLDLIIGGHSHTILETSTAIKDLDGKEIQIVQTGFNGRYIGKILLEVTSVKGNRKVRVLSYELVPVLRDDPQDAAVAAEIVKAKAAVKEEYGPRLNEVIATSTVRLISGDSGPTAFSKLAVDSMREITGAEVAFDIGAFHGLAPQAAGTITRQNLMEMYPRKFDVEQNVGLFVYEARVPGILIEIALKYAMKFGEYISTSGITYEVNRMSNSDFEQMKKSLINDHSYTALTPYFPSNILIGGKPLKSMQWYSSAAPESLVLGGFGISPLLKLIVRNAHASPHTIWDAMNASLLKSKTLGKLRLEDHFNLPAFSASDQHQYAVRHNFDQFQEGEGFVAPWINQFASHEDVINKSIEELMRTANMEGLINSEINSVNWGPIDAPSGSTHP